MTFDARPIATMSKLVIDKRASDPILDMVLMRDGTATMTDLDQALTLDVPGGPVAPVLVPRDLLTKAGRDGVTIEGATARVAGVAVDITTTCSVNDWPHMAPVQDDPASSLTMPLGDLRAMLRDVAPAMSDEAVRYYLRGVHFNGRQESEGAPSLLRLEATQGHILLAATTRLPWTVQAILPRRAVAVLLALPGDDATPVTVVFHKYGAGRFIFTGPGWRFEAKAVDGSFPVIDRVFPSPESHAGTWTVAADHVTDVVKRLTRFVDKRGRGLAFDMVAGSASMGGGKASAPLPGRVAPVTGVPGQMIGINADYLRAMAEIAKGQDVSIDYAVTEPWRIEYEDRATHRLVGVVMPVRM